MEAEWHESGNGYYLGNRMGILFWFKNALFIHPLMVIQKMGYRHGFKPARPATEAELRQFAEAYPEECKTPVLALGETIYNDGRKTTALEAYYVFDELKFKEVKVEVEDFIPGFYRFLGIV